MWRQVLEAFAAERLLTLAAGTVELSHEALLTAWPLLRDTWLADTRADRIARTRLHTTAAEWARHARDPSYLYAGSLLQAATDTAARIGADPARNPPLSQAEQDFLHASDRAHRRKARGRQAVIAGLLALTLTALTTAGIAVRNAANVTRQHALALSRQLAAESLSVDPTDHVTARRLAVAAWRVFPTTQAYSAMTTLLAGQQQDWHPARRPTRRFRRGVQPRRQAAGQRRLRRQGPAMEPGHPPSRRRAPPDRVRPLRAACRWWRSAPNGKLLASADTKGTVRLWNPVTRQPVGMPLQKGRQKSGGVFGLAFSPNGKLLASEDETATVRFWNPVDPPARRRATPDPWGRERAGVQPRRQAGNCRQLTAQCGCGIRSPTIARRF